MVMALHRFFPVMLVAAALAAPVTAHAAAATGKLAISPAAGHAGRLAGHPDQRARGAAGPDRFRDRARLEERRARRPPALLLGRSRRELRARPRRSRRASAWRRRCGSGAAGRSALAFTVAHLAPAQPVLNITTRQPSKLQQFVTLPDLVPPRISVLQVVGRDARATSSSRRCRRRSSTRAATTSSTISPVGPGGPMIVDGRGDLVWFKQLAPPDVAANLRLQRFGGRTVLTWWQGPVTPSAFGLGEGVIAEQLLPDDRAPSTPATATRWTSTSSRSRPSATPSSRSTRRSSSTCRARRRASCRRCSTRSCRRSTSAPGSWCGSGTPTATSRSPTPTRRPPTAPPTTPSTSTRSRRCRAGACWCRRATPRRSTRSTAPAAGSPGRSAARRAASASAAARGSGSSTTRRCSRTATVSLFDDEAGPPQKGPTSRGLVLRLDPRGRRATLVERSTAARRTPRPRARAACRRCRAATCSPASGRSRSSRSSRGAAGSVRREPAPGRRQLPRLPLPLEGDADARCPTLRRTRTGPSSVSVYASWNGATDGGALAGPRGAGGRHARGGIVGRQAGLRDAHRLQRHGDRLRRAGT